MALSRAHGLSRSGSGTPPYTIRWLVSQVHGLELTESVVAGTAALVRAGAISLILEPLGRSRQMESIMRWDIRDTRTDICRKVAFDELDRSDLFDLETLSEVDVYFKRSYSRQAIAALPEEFRYRVQASGITFGCRSDGSWKVSARAALVCGLSRLRSEGLRGAKPAIKRLLQHLNYVEGYLNTSAYHRAPCDPVNDRIVYQTRIWPPSSRANVDRREVNQERMNIVRALRAEFGGPDLIGLIRNPLAEETAPDALLSRRVSRREYARQLRTSLIAVSSHGLDGSAGYKLGEALAAGCALVSQPFLFELPEPMLPEVNYLPFTTPEECVAQCRRLLADRPLAERIRAANRRYYWEFVHPEAHVRRLLARAFQAGQDRPSAHG